MDARDVKAMELTGNTRIAYVAGTWMVPSQSSAGRHKVNPSPTAPSCTCEDFQLRNRPCKHIMAVRQLLERQLKGQPHPDPATIPLRPKRPTYKQDWAAYNLAQTNEKDHFQVLLADLCRTVPQPAPKNAKGGRPTHSLSDALFAACFKVYSLMSARRFMSDLREAHERGHIGELVSYNSTLEVFGKEGVTEALTDLIERSALPLRAVESTFAVDSSGFATSRYVKWFDEKYGVNREKAAWVKAHLCCGVNTQIVTAVVVDEKNSGDCPQFAGLVNTTAERFGVKEVCADKAYLSNDNLNLVESLGAASFVPFKTNSSPDGSELWRRMYFYFQLRRDDFLAHYHQRSNVESCFSMVKRKFGDSVRARTDTAMRNEVLAKVLCHNLCCVIQAWYELGIEPGQWAPSVPTCSEKHPLATTQANPYPN
jgi:transposase